MGHWRFCDSRFRRHAWLPSASAQEVGCVLFVYRFATWRDCDNDPYPRRRYRLQFRRDPGDYSDATDGGGVFDLVFETSQEQGLDQLGTTDVTPSALDTSGVMDLVSILSISLFAAN